MSERMTTRMVKKQRLATADKALLVVIRAPEGSPLAEGQSFAVKPVSMIGRLDDSTIALGDDSISRDHAMIEHRADGWYLNDNGSTNGTFLAGRRIEGSVHLSRCEQITFGEVKMLFWQGTSADAALATELKKHSVALL